VSSPAAEVRIIASGLEFPEGPVALPDGSVLVTEIAAGTLAKVFPDGSIEHIAHLGGGPNGAAIGPDGAGWVCQATLIEGGVTQISPDGQTVETLPLSDPMITNLCFGGPDHRTAYITSSGTGHLIAVEWPRPGGLLAFPRKVRT